MKFGVVYPQVEFGNDPLYIRDYAQQAEELGYHHILAYDHVLGANPERPGGWNGPYTHRTPFQEPFVLFAFMAGVTTRIQFATGIIILPQRQTVLVAKQAATLDVLSNGRLRLGVGLGWNFVEYTSLNQDFHNRGKRIEEQIEVMRLLWQQPLVTYSGRWHTIPDAGLNPLPVQRSIPIWFGGHSEKVLKRTASLGDGWMPNYRSSEDARNSLDQLFRFLANEGRDRSSFGIEARISYGDGNPETWRSLISDWKKAGATHITVNTMGLGFNKPQDHLTAIRKFAEIENLLFETS